jgi:hypothetical protein
MRWIEESPAQALLAVGSGYTMLGGVTAVIYRSHVPWFVGVICFILMWWAVGQAIASIHPPNVREEDK